MEAVGIGLIIFGLSYLVLDVIEKWWHERRHDKSKSYRWGVWVFAVLAGLYAYLTSLGR